MSYDLNQQIELANRLIRKLERVKRLWDGIPTIEEIDELANTAGGLADQLDRAIETSLSDNFPSVDSLEEIARPAAELAENVQHTMQTYMSDEFPTADSLEETARSAAELADSLGEIVGA